MDTQLILNAANDIMGYTGDERLDKITPAPLHIDMFYFEKPQGAKNGIIVYCSISRIYAEVSGQWFELDYMD